MAWWSNSKTTWLKRKKQTEQPDGRSPFLTLPRRPEVILPTHPLCPQVGLFSCATWKPIATPNANSSVPSRTPCMASQQGWKNFYLALQKQPSELMLRCGQVGWPMDRICTGRGQAVYIYSWLHPASDPDAINGWLSLLFRWQMCPPFPQGLDKLS